MSLPALLELFRRHREKASGILRIGGEGGRAVYMDMGDIVFAQSGAAEDRLTSILVERGKLTQAQMDYALANLKPGLSIGKNLIDMGFITQRDLLETARTQVERIVWRVMATLEDAPAFEACELGPTVVRLPLDTPALLLSGLLALGDREKVLDLLGPVNQVVVLEGRRSYELVIPQDLTKILSLLDGTRTILEISRDSGIEPFRLGAFCLFLREMGWGRLYELPPLDRGALEQALLPESEPLTPPLPISNSSPALMAAIEAAAEPTRRLDSIAEALDAIPEPPSTPTPATPLAPLPEEEEDPSLAISEASSISMLPPAALTEPKKRSRIYVPLLLIIFALFGFAWWMKRSARPAQATHLPPSPPPASGPPAAPEPAPQVEPPIQAEPPPFRFDRDERLGAIREGAWDRVLRQGLAHRGALDSSRWTLRLEIACLGATVQHAEALLGQKAPDLWVIPIQMRDGKTCYQVLLGDFPTQAAANQGMKRLPKIFRTPGNTPKVFRISELPDKQ